ncbi:hypothetical protein PSN45_004463 [Yamadazyma tenuis]|uniref:Cullin family profile domain-containing protein n=1 Tax=Candida tenuis (strain ATCC 10573 / BCRC 21748 / CBS 615 / JCM 9827 / NBRC 10315 / NRRL Y-1498 / VKM Y-70) TaxID=590646 RepID=G3B5M7_CANTC|nr:uncharacterized protein CANTEDRAFT_106606 [Yamadazyma tenuis ATCC 10573]EGV63266.1 hypothetical protein CANTEDRAFT_106606 [Yamadazyma tenuis ATCC 10573]WEJ96918.1 hypothetical protein PSN45_004463 [Yamadazyma tenuis]
MLPPGSRTSKIKPPRKSITNSSLTNTQAFDFNKSWDVLSSAIVQIQNKNVSNLSYEQLYRKAYTLVLHKFGNRLYENVEELIETHLLRRRTKLLSIFSQSSSASFVNVDEEFIKNVLSEWNEHLQAMKFISDVLMYLNRVYIKEQNRLLIYDLGIKLYKDCIIKYNDNEVGTRIINILINEIQKNRNGEIISTKMYITNIIGMFELLHEDNTQNDLSVFENYYQKYFEPVFLSTSNDYFNNLIEKFLNYGSGLKYLIETNQFLSDEIDRIDLYLPESTVPKLIDLMNNTLIKSQLDNIINFPSDSLQSWIQPIKDNIILGEPTDSGIPIDNDSLNYLKILYSFNSRIDSSCELLKVRLKDIIIKEGKQFPSLIKNLLNSGELGERKKPISPNSPAFANKWIGSILLYKAQFSKIVKDAFDHDYSMEQCIISAIQEFINLNAKSKKNNNDFSLLIVNPSELLSVCMDNHIKQYLKPNSIAGSRDKGITSNDASFSSIDEFINKSLQFLRFIVDKDTFEAYYKNHFAKRFLNAKGFNQDGSTGIDIEDFVISKLSEELGTTSLDTIIKMNMDIKSSRGVTSEWKNFLVENKDKSIIDMDLKICNISYWPNSMTKDYKKLSGKQMNPDSSTTFIWPRRIKHTIQRFESFWTIDKKNSNKSLYWCPKFGSMDLKITYPSKTFEINLPTYAGVVLLLFGPSYSLDSDSEVNSEDFNPFKDKKKLTYKEIEELTGIPEVELKRHLQSIAVASRSRLLTKTPMSKDVNDNDIFELNEKFKSPSTKVKVLTVSASSSTNTAGGDGRLRKSRDEELEDIESSIAEGRKHEINAATVRILKSRQSIYHNELVTEIIRQLQGRFLPNNSQIKRHLEDLIEKEYLKRDDNNRNLYHYIA